jgi:hypothetical protein
MVYLSIATAAATSSSTMVPMMATAMAAAAVVHEATTSAIADTGAAITAVATVTGDGLAVTA